jgi:5'-nucleotidase
MHRSLFRLSAVLLVLLLGTAAAACSSDDDSGDGSGEAEDSSDDSTGSGAGGDETTTTEADETLRILLTNDTGVGGVGYAAMAEALQELPDVELTLSAPADDQSGTSDSTTDGEVTSTEAEVAGVPATAVAGYPADSVLAAIDAAPEGAGSFDLVVSGTNEGPNIGDGESVSGTVGAARTGARNGIPALAVSQGIAGSLEAEFVTASQIAVGWIEENRADILATPDNDPFLYNLNVPACTPEEMKDLLALDEGAVPIGDRNILEFDCTSGAEPVDEVQAFIIGYPVIVPLEIA